MRKLIGILVFLAALSILLTAMNQSFVNRIKQDRYFEHLRPDAHKPFSLYRSIFLSTDRWAYGDLYGISFLPEYRIKLSPFSVYDHQTNKLKPAHRVLYIIGDSFTADKEFARAFGGFEQVVFLDRRFPFGPVRPDTTRENYLIMEFSELNLADSRFTKSQELITNNPSAPGPKPVSLPRRLGHILFNKELNKNLEQLLFDASFFTKAKELKASINEHLLGRLPKEIRISTDKKRLLLSSTVDTTSPQSVFRPLSRQDLAIICARLKTDQQRYLSMGFKKVYLSLIPNAASVYDLQRDTYNQLLSKVEQSSGIPLISVYPIFKNDPRNLYSRSDAHWNDLGYGIWVDQVNLALYQAIH